MIGQAISASERPLAIDLFTGLHGWADGLITEGFRVVGFDLEDMCAQFGQPKPSHFNLVIQDVLTLHGSQFRDAALIVASPPCQEPSYRAMPWSRAKALNAAGPPENFIKLFEACFRIQREACEAAGRHIPLVVENVRGAQPWVGRARWNFGSFFLWGDVPALMPTLKGRENNGGSWFAIGGPGQKVTRQNPDGRNVAAIPETDGRKVGGDWFGAGKDCSLQRRASSGSKARKAASAMIARIPEPLSRHIAATYRPTHHG